VSPRANWSEYLIEAAGLGLFMLSAASFATLLEHPGSPLRTALPSALVRRGFMGMAMGLTAIGIIYSPWGRRSGAHINPSVTLTYFRLGKIAPRDAAAYVAAQFVGGAAGLGLAALLLGDALGHASVGYVATRPGAHGLATAFAAEVTISFGLMNVVLWASNRPGLERFTGALAGCLVAAYITFEAPISGMSMNPARTFASALAGGDFSSLWIYFTAPPLGMLAAAEAYCRVLGKRAVECAKLRHDERSRCIFCEYQHP
jgi:aquaporin Z